MKISTVLILILFSTLILVNLPVYGQSLPAQNTCPQGLTKIQQPNGFECVDPNSPTNTDTLQKFNREHSGKLQAVEDISEIIQSSKTGTNLQLNSTFFIFNDLSYTINISGDLGSFSISPGESYSHLFDTVGDFNLKVVNSTLTISVKDWKAEQEKQLQDNKAYVNKLLGNDNVANETTITIMKGSSNDNCSENNSCLSSSMISVQPNMPVRWWNNDFTPHVIASGKPSDNETGLIFKSDLLKPDDSFRFNFTKEGTYDYFDQLDPWISGQVIVTNSTHGTIDLHDNHNSPKWIKKIFQWYDEGKLTENELFSFVKYLIDNKIMGK